MVSRNGERGGGENYICNNYAKINYIICNNYAKITYIDIWIEFCYKQIIFINNCFKHFFNGQKQNNNLMIGIIYYIKSFSSQTAVKGKEIITKCNPWKPHDNDFIQLQRRVSFSQLIKIYYNIPTLKSYTFLQHMNTGWY